jgi:hypothetical protein
MGLYNSEGILAGFPVFTKQNWPSRCGSQTRIAQPRGKKMSFFKKIPAMAAMAAMAGGQIAES